MEWLMEAPVVIDVADGVVVRVMGPGKSAERATQAVGVSRGSLTDATAK
jgi:hypothetical protein